MTTNKDIINGGFFNLTKLDDNNPCLETSTSLEFFLPYKKRKYKMGRKRRI